MCNVHKGLSTIQLGGTTLEDRFHTKTYVYFIDSKGCYPNSNDGSWNSMMSAHPNGQIFADLVTCPYCFMGEEESYHSMHLSS